MARLRAVAFTDSVHSCDPGDPAPLRAFLRSHAINFVTRCASLCSLALLAGPLVSRWHVAHSR